MQTLLPSKKVKVVVDSREISSRVVEELLILGCEIIERNIAVGDYVCSERVCVERKSAQDFVASIIDGRLFEQLSKLSEHYERPVLIIEGYNFFSRNIHENALYGALASCTLDFNVTMLHSSNPQETAKIIYSLAKREQLKSGRNIAFKVKPKPKELEKIQLNLVASLPFISVKLAERLLKTFGTPRAVFTASEGALQRVEGIGEKKARIIWKVLNKRWKEFE